MEEDVSVSESPGRTICSASTSASKMDLIPGAVKSTFLTLRAWVLKRGGERGAQRLRTWRMRKDAIYDGKESCLSEFR